MVGQPIAQKLMAKFDIRLVTGVSVTLSSAAVLAMAFYNNIVGWYISAVIDGMGLCVTCYLLFPICLGNWFKKSYGTVFGIVSCMSGLGGALFNALVGKWIGIYGYQHTYIIIAIISWIFTFPFCVFVLRTKPEDKGVLPYGVESESEINLLNEKDNAQLTKEQKGFTFEEAVRTPYFWMVFIAVLCIHFMGTFQNQIVNFATSVGFPIQQAAIVGSCLLFGSVVGKIGLGWIHDHFGVRAAYITAITSILIALVLFVTGDGKTGAVYVGGACFGIGYAIMAIGTPLLIRKTLGTKDYAKIFSYAIAAGTCVNIFAPLVYSGIYDSTGSYYPGLFICGGVLIVALILVNVVVSKTKHFWD